MSFMQKQITNKQKWLQIDGTSHGAVYIPLDVLRISQEMADDMNWRSNFVAIGDYYPGGPFSIARATIITGYGCRMSAPGYMDCTDWEVFDTPEECAQALGEQYGNDESDIQPQG